MKNKDCFICFKKNDNISITVCIHKIHTPCLIKWLNKNNSCPLCRKKNPIHEYIIFKNMYAYKEYIINKKKNKALISKNKNNNLYIKYLI